MSNLLTPPKIYKLTSAEQSHIKDMAYKLAALKINVQHGVGGSISSKGGGGIMIEGESGMTLYTLTALRSALHLEAKTGMKLSRGRSALSIAKKKFNLKGDTKKVYYMVNQIFEESEKCDVRICPKCDVLAVVPLDEKKVKELGEPLTTHMCHPALGGCNAGFGPR